MNSPLKHKGFTLVELMVSLVIGLLIVLGAGQLFMNGFQSFQQVERLGEKQAALIFAAEALIRNIRRADPGSFNDDWPVEEGIKYSFVVDGDRYDYDLREGKEGSQGWELYMAHGGSSLQPVVGGFSEGSDAFLIKEKSAGFYQITFKLLSSSDGHSHEIVVFHAMNRTAAVTDLGSDYSL